jgi:hypothetical protein
MLGGPMGAEVLGYGLIQDLAQPEPGGPSIPAYAKAPMLGGPLGAEVLGYGLIQDLGPPTPPVGTEPAYLVGAGFEFGAGAIGATPLPPPPPPPVGSEPNYTIGAGFEFGIGAIGTPLDTPAAPEPFDAGGTLALLTAEGIIAAPVSATVEASLSALTAEGSALFQAFRPAINPASIPSYTAVLTDPASGLADVPIKISSIQLRYREDGSGYMSVVVPNGVSHVDDILARPNAKVVVTFSQDTVSAEMGRFTPTFIRTDEGPSSQSLTLSGDAESVDVNSGSVVKLDAVSYVSVTSDAVRYRTVVRGDIKPGDTVEYGVNSGVVRSISMSVSAGASQMEIEV